MSILNVLTTTIELGIATQYDQGKMPIADMKDMLKRFYGVHMKTGAQYQILNLIIEKIQFTIEHFEGLEEQELNNLENQSTEP